MEIPEKLFKRNIDEIRVGISSIILATKEEIDDYQLGYQINGVTGDKIEEWFGDEFVVIGEDTTCGDPIIVKVDEAKLPVYWMIHDDWRSLTKIAEDFDAFLQILNHITETDLSVEEEKDNLIEKILVLTNEKAMIYWESLITNAYEFYNEEE